MGMSRRDAVRGIYTQRQMHLPRHGALQLDPGTRQVNKASRKGRTAGCVSSASPPPHGGPPSPAAGPPGADQRPSARPRAADSPCHRVRSLTILATLCVQQHCRAARRPLRRITAAGAAPRQTEQRPAGRRLGCYYAVMTLCRASYGARTAPCPGQGGFRLDAASHLDHALPELVREALDSV